MNFKLRSGFEIRIAGGSANEALKLSLVCKHFKQLLKRQKAAWLRMNVVGTSAFSWPRMQHVLAAVEREPTCEVQSLSCAPGHIRQVRDVSPGEVSLKFLPASECILHSVATCDMCGLSLMCKLHEAQCSKLSCECGCTCTWCLGAGIGSRVWHLVIIAEVQIGRPVYHYSNLGVWLGKWASTTHGRELGGMGDFVDFMLSALHVTDT